ncbi:Uncharacterized metal-binding protein YceD, DUF177 family [Tranquillimonas rosea]|uniref:Uncharacterized metal-binding protein YceD, DUF177 family n=1 Tax=Tranquillimonas rosea TaxID=641238 RepID=A0A1H9TK12_9RHOB|nr:DUF177 domain-containing protein [Tranquillimonas rosea]SER96943.1 Uncharacterized metal-binding protein YceD, DUF177 family [Tranquillimonas rosea]
MAPQRLPWSHSVALGDLSARAARDIAVAPDAEARTALAQDLGIRSIRKLRLDGRLAPTGRDDWRFVGTLGATVVQECVVTLEPVTTRIDEPVERLFTTQRILDETEEGEVEMPEDTAPEPLTDPIDLGAVMAEELSLALPPFPRAPEAELGEKIAGPPDTEPLRDEDTKPFAGLAGLRDKLDDKNGGGEPET